MIERFLNLPVVVETSLGPVVGVLVAVGSSIHGGVDALLVHDFVGSWHLIVRWTVIKSGRVHM